MIFLKTETSIYDRHTLFRWRIARAVSCSTLVHVVITVLIVCPQTTVVERDHILEPVGQGGDQARLDIGCGPPVMASVGSTTLECIGGKSKLPIMTITALISSVIWGPVNTMPYGQSWSYD